MKTIVALSALLLLLASGCSVPSHSSDAGLSDEPVDHNTCLFGQDLNAADVDISRCPILPEMPMPKMLGGTREEVSLGAWELGQTAEGEVYKYGSLTPAGTTPRRLQFYEEEESTIVNAENISCWAKGYFRLRRILERPPASYVKLRAAGFQVRFFQFQTDLRNGPTGFREISSYRDHLVKWVTVIDEDGTCIQPTLQKFEDYVEAELVRRGLETTD